MTLLYFYPEIGLNVFYFQSQKQAASSILASYKKTKTGKRWMEAENRINRLMDVWNDEWKDIHFFIWNSQNQGGSNPLYLLDKINPQCFLFSCKNSVFLKPTKFFFFKFLPYLFYFCREANLTIWGKKIEKFFLK